MHIDSITIGDRHRKDMGDIDGLARSIAEIGLLHPVVVTPAGLLIAGQRRLEACKRLGLVDVPVTIVDLADVVRGEKAENEERKDFTWSEKVAIAEAAEPLQRAAAKERQASHTASGYEKFTDPGPALDHVAQAVGTSRPTLQKAMAVVKAAEQEPDLLADVVKKMDETGNVSAALKEVKKRLRQQEDHATIDNLPPAPDRFVLFDGDFRPICAGHDGESVDVIITDPPYERDSLPLYADLAIAAAHVLKDGGSLFVMAGQSYLPDVMASLSAHLTYHWTLAYLTPGGQAVQLWDRKVNTFWKPVLWYVKGEYAGPWLGDVTKSNVNANEKDAHHWQQSESGMADLVQRCSQAGDLVLDPFCGSGTTGVAALAMGRRFIGIDIDAVALDVARARLLEAAHESR